jgi:hypothetical protein
MISIIRGSSLLGVSEICFKSELRGLGLGDVGSDFEENFLPIGLKLFPLDQGGNRDGVGGSPVQHKGL